MLMIPGFDGAQNVDRRNIRARESAIMHDLLNACADRSDLLRQICQVTRTIANDCRKSAKATIGDQTALYYAAENIWVDVAAAKQEYHAFSCEFV